MVVALTFFEVGDCLQDLTVGVESLGPTDPARGVPVRVQDDLGVDKVSRGNSFVQGLAKSSSRHHVYRRLGETVAPRKPYLYAPRHS